MATSPNIADQQDAALARLLELGLAAAEKVQARLMATEDDASLGDLSLALNRASRNVRQTIALQMRAARDRRLERQEAGAEVRRADDARRSHHRRRLKATIERLIWDEHEDREAEKLIDRLDVVLEQEALAEDFGAEPLEAHLARLCDELGVNGPYELAPHDLPLPSADAPAEQWRSSA